MKDVITDPYLKYNNGLDNPPLNYCMAEQSYSILHNGCNNLSKT